MKESDFAYPHLDHPGYFNACKGMSLRCWLAGQALTGLTAHAETKEPEEIAQAAVSIADALLAKLGALE